VKANFTKIVMGLLIIACVNGGLSADAADYLSADSEAEVVGGAVEPYGGMGFAGATSLSEAYDLLVQNAVSQEALSVNTAEVTK
jgi:hypothetical protein